MARTRAADYDDKRNAILKQSSRLFADGGFERTSMSQVATTCGVSKALLYHYYDSKEALLYDILYGHLKELVDAVEEAERLDGSAEDRLRALVGAILDAYRDADAEHKVQINALASLPEDKQRELKAMERSLVDKVAAVVAQVNPALDNGSPMLKPVTMSLFGMLNWHYMWYRPDGPVGREDYADLATKLIINGAREID